DWSARPDISRRAQWPPPSPLFPYTTLFRSLAEGWEVTTWSGNGRSVRTAEGLVLDDLRGPEAAAEADLLVFPSWPTDLPEPEARSEEHTSELQSRFDLVCRLLLEKTNLDAQ